MDFQGTIERLLGLAQHYPDAAILLACSGFGMLLTLALEWWFLPTVADPQAKRRQKGMTFLFCWFISAVSSTVLWSLVDPADPLLVRMTVSVIAGVFGFFLYPPLARRVADRWPSIGTAWDSLRN